MTQNPKKGLNRRDFFKIAVTSGAGLAVASCTNDPVEKIIPYITPPNDLTLAKPYYFATICKECPAQCGLEVKVVNGRAIQVIGNSQDPLNQGGICPVGNASLQSLYNPARIQKASYNQEELNQTQAIEKFAELVDAHRKKVLYIAPTRKDTKTKLVNELIQELGGDSIEFTTLPLDSIKSAGKQLFNLNQVPDYKMSQAQVVVNFGAEFLDFWLDAAEMSRGFAQMHALKNKNKNKFYHISSHMGLTGSNADRWISCPAGSEYQVAMACIHQIVDQSRLNEEEKNSVKNYVAEYSIQAVSKSTGIAQDVLIDLTKSIGVNGQAIVIGGGLSSHQEGNTDLQVAIHLLNYVAGAINKTVYYYNESIENDLVISLEQGLKNLKNNKYSLVIIEDVNLLHALPLSSNLASLLKDKEVVVLSTSHNETTAAANLLIPLASFYESWGDAQSKNGVYRLQQPVMGKLPPYQVHESGQLWMEIGKKVNSDHFAFKQADFKSYLTNQWLKIQFKVANSDSFKKFWNSTLMNGFVQAKQASRTIELSTTSLGRQKKNKLNEQNGLKLVTFNTSLQNAESQTGDKPWLLEIPHPITQVVWGNWAEINDKTAKKFGIEHGDEITVTTENGQFNLGAYVYFGIAENTIGIPAGYGRNLLFPNYSQRRNAFLPFTKDEPKKLKSIQVGENVLNLLSLDFDKKSSASTFLAKNKVSIKKTGKKSDMVAMDGAHKLDLHTDPHLVEDAFGDRSQKHRVIFATATLDEIKKEHIKHDEHHHELRKRNFTLPHSDNPSEMYEKQPEVVQKDFFGHKGKGQEKIKYHDPYRFEMVIDLEKCTGCSSCVVACYAENNIPVVGKERVSLGRSMAWLRVERFFDQNESSKEYTQTNFGPTMCQQCDNAGCEPVCPVYATYHNPDGLNAQVYNRCIGTRYCSNNCVYKQRKFNWRTYEFSYPLNMQLNPEVTVREKGVMEKCTFCVQRIRSKKEEASLQGRELSGDEVQTACQASCPTNAIQFGNGKDQKSTVNKLKNNIRAFKQLENLNFQPAITYLRKIVPSEPNVV